MLLLTMPRSPSPDKGKLREIFLSSDIVARLNERKAQTDVPVAAQIRRAIEAYVETPYEGQHRLYTTKREERVPCNIPERLWTNLRERKVETGLDLNEQVQIAVALYLQSDVAFGTPLEQNQPQSQSQGGEFELTPPPGRISKKPAPLDADEEARLRRLINEELDQKFSLFEQLQAAGHNVRRARPATLQTPQKVPRRMMVSCGEGDDADLIIEFTGEQSTTEITDASLALKVTPNSFVAVANGWSMSRDGSRMSIQSGDELLLTPIDEYPRAIKDGTIILAQIEFKDGRTVQTLKAYEKKRLRANNPAYAGFELGPNMKSAVIIAVCRGVLPKVFD